MIVLLAVRVTLVPLDTLDPVWNMVVTTHAIRGYPPSAGGHNFIYMIATTGSPNTVIIFVERIQPPVAMTINEVQALRDCP